MRYFLSAAFGGAMAVAAMPAAAAIVIEAPAPEATPAMVEARAPAHVAAHAGGDAAELPEPATWAMLFLGFGGMSFALRRRRRATARIRFA